MLDPVIEQLRQDYEKTRAAWAQVQGDWPHDPGTSQHMWRLSDEYEKLKRTLTDLGYPPQDDAEYWRSRRSARTLRGEHDSAAREATCDGADSENRPTPSEPPPAQGGE